MRLHFFVWTKDHKHELLVDYLPPHSFLVLYSLCSKLAQRDYKNTKEWIGKVIHWDLCEKLKFDQTNKCNMYYLESVRENETQNSLGFWDTNGSLNIGQTNRPSDSQQKKRTYRICKSNAKLNSYFVSFKLAKLNL